MLAKNNSLCWILLYDRVFNFGIVKIPATTEFIEIQLKFQRFF